ncbi:AraC family transcriptional regulator [Amycolatopsis sp.]|uniref:AraC family transcriptional regulator n=1 Tax=Amycolatopsis sp. TaxID=37632 RepID=UPI002DFE915A|nr:AraC family transcriptional regulator [Amycolatopsis sp.]
MDTLADLLDGVRAKGALITQSILSSPWSLRFASGAQLTLVTMLRGRAWIVPAAGEAVLLGAGDIAIVRGPAPYTVSNDPTIAPQRVITSADYCTRTVRAVQDDGPALSARTCGVAEDGSALLLSGAYDGKAGISGRLLDVLPEALVVRDGDNHFPMLDLVAAEIARDRPGQQAVLDRLLDLILISTLRAWFDRPQSRAPVWYRELDDAVVGHALRLVHDNPAHPWTVATLAAEVGVSRAAFARRFVAQVGEPPMSYLAGWRIALASDLLRETNTTVGSIARKVGYANTFALSVAFKRRRGITPTEHRSEVAPRVRAG